MHIHAQKGGRLQSLLLGSYPLRQIVTLTKRLYINTSRKWGKPGLDLISEEGNGRHCQSACKSEKWRGQRQALPECMQRWSIKSCLKLWRTYYPSMHSNPHQMPTPPFLVQTLPSIEVAMPLMRRMYTHHRNTAGLDISMFLNRVRLTTGGVHLEAVDEELPGALTRSLRLSSGPQNFTGICAGSSRACAAL